MEETDPDVCIFDAAKVAKWQAAGTLQIVRQDKENGKFAIIKMFRLEGQLLAVGGSKNQHVVVSEETIGEVIEDRENRCLLSQIFFRIKEQWESLAGLFDAFPDYSLVGELCDGLHFVPIDNDIPEIKWFGLFGAGGVAMDPRLALGAVVDAGLPAVRYELLDARRGIEEVIREGRAGNGEGNVLYFRDEATGEVVLAKNKAAAYIVKRMARAILKAGGYSGLLFRLPKRIAEAAEYHQLCTSAAVRLCHQLFGLSEWMLLNRIPTTSMDINDTDRNGNVGPQGFASVWREYVASGAGQEMEVTPEDIGGAFDPDAFFKATRRSPQPLVGLTGAPKHVVFFQGVQGSGKSSLGAVLAKELASQGAKAAVLEQDQFGGHSPSCRSALEHMLKFSDLRVVLVTRCNANPKHYSAYVDIAHRCGARVSFLTPSQPPHDVALASALAGIAERSSSAPPGLLRLGPSLLPRDEVHRIVSMTLADFCPHPQGQIYNPLNTSSGALSRLPSPLPQPCGGPRAAWLYVEQHGAALRALRRPLEDIARELLPMVLEPPPEALVRPSLDTCTLVAFYPESAAAAAALAEVAQQHNPAAARDELHLTQLVITPDRKKRQEFLGGLRGVPTRMGERLSVRVSALVTRLEDGHMSFRVEVPEGTWIQSGRPHITVYVPSGHIAKESNFYVHKADNTVDTKELHPPLEIGMVCWWT